MIYASGALIPVGYKTPVYAKDTTLPWKCPVKLGLSQHSCDLWFGTLSELGVHFVSSKSRIFLGEGTCGFADQTRSRLFIGKSYYAMTATATSPGSANSPRILRISVHSLLLRHGYLQTTAPQKPPLKHNPPTPKSCGSISCPSSAGPPRSMAQSLSSKAWSSLTPSLVIRKHRRWRIAPRKGT